MSERLLRSHRNERARPMVRWSSVARQLHFECFRMPEAAALICGDMSINNSFDMSAFCSGTNHGWSQLASDVRSDQRDVRWGESGGVSPPRLNSLFTGPSAALTPHQ